MRISDRFGTGGLALTFIAMTGGCSTDAGEPESLTGGETAAVQCALGQSTEFTDGCDVERVQNGETRGLVMRHPDGGFRRFEIVDDGRGLVAADGSEEAVVTPLTDGRIEVSVGRDRYRLPATIKPGAAAGGA
ncbi:hypothetical protein [Blastomonas sp.]|uniref:hypothetical protein n=1 Tax=Blastomonas sp. TaxID=1909299 RepID=UPI003593972C